MGNPAALTNTTTAPQEKPRAHDPFKSPLDDSYHRAPSIIPPTRDEECGPSRDECRADQPGRSYAPLTRNRHQASTAR